MATQILVVDDDPDILDAIQFTLEDSGFTVQTSEKGDVLERLSHNGKLPELIILDVLLSGQDGRVICKKLKSQKTTKKIPILMISAHPNADITVKEAGADAFIAKPFDVDYLISTVKQFVK